MGIIDKTKAWYRGKYIPPPPNDPNSRLVFMLVGRYEQPRLAKLLRVLGRFYLAHWQWIIGTAIAVVGVVVALRPR